jgi:Leucine-rich repeat (LRR) protein
MEGGEIMGKQLYTIIGAYFRRLPLRLLLCVAAAAALAVSLPTPIKAAATEMKESGFAYTVSAGAAHIVGYDGSNATGCTDEVKVPAKIGGFPVASIELYDIGGSSLDLRSCEKLKSFYAEMLFFDSIYLPKKSKLQSFALHESGAAKKLDLNACTDMRSLYLDVESLQKLSVGKCAKLGELFVFNSLIGSLDVSGNAALKSLAAESNAMAGIKLGEKRRLKSLHLSGNRLGKLNISGCKALMEIDFSWNAGLSVDISKNKKLRKLTYSPAGAGVKQVTVNNPLKTNPKAKRYTNG